VFFSLNEIEKINDGLGYQIGDILIRTVAERLKNRFEPKNLIENNYRITLSRKDVFIILIDNIHKINEIKEKASALLTVLDTPIMTEKQPLKLTASIGISLYPRHGKEIKTLLMNADSAMLRAKQQGGNNLKIYKADIDAKISRQLEIEANLHFALDKNEFVLHYQPIINLKTGKICSAEALLRWNSLALGSIPPTDFIPLAEANGIIFPLGNWVARTACIQNKIWHDMGFTSFRMAINISAKQLANKAILQIFEDILTETKLNPEFIELELTEGVAFQDNAVPLLKRFKSMGFQLSIDDFGTGYSGLSTLKLFNIDTLKIDKIFVDDVEKNNDNSTIVSNTIALAQEMDLSVIAEGVETIEQVNFLKAHGCDMIQGYYFSKPVDAETFTKLLTSGTLFGG
jgi:diguanylate cyclase (GGDEF)-like protein